MNKKASLNLSIQAIVIVVIAFVVLGLGLGFVKGTFKDISGTSKEVQAKIKEQILEDMRTSGKKLSVSKEISIERGKQLVENVGVVNTDITTKKFGIKIEPIKKRTPDGTEITDVAVIDSEIDFFYDDSVEKRLSPTMGDVIPVTITARSGAVGNYLYKVRAVSLDLVSGDQEEYDVQTFFVKVS